MPRFGGGANITILGGLDYALLGIWVSHLVQKFHNRELENRSFRDAEVSAGSVYAVLVLSLFKNTLSLVTLPFGSLGSVSGARSEGQGIVPYTGFFYNFENNSSRQLRAQD